MPSLAPFLSSKGRQTLEKAFRAMRKMPMTFNMDTFMSHDVAAHPVRGRPRPYCGTVACLAGHIDLAANGDQAIATRGLLIFPRDTSRRALNALGITLDYWKVDHQLFHTYGWPDTFRRRYRNARSHRGRVVVAIARVRYWLKTGK